MFKKDKIMKKTYQSPNIKVVRIVQQLLSGASGLEKYSTPVTDETEVLSRESYSLWDDED